jgi:hypothetical protein
MRLELYFLAPLGMTPQVQVSLREGRKTAVSGLLPHDLQFSSMNPAFCQTRLPDRAKQAVTRS